MWLQLGGFILLVLGTLVFNEILVVPFLGFNLFTRAALEKAKKEDSRGLLDNTQTQLQNETPNYSGLSPHASYDATRYQKNLADRLAERDGKHLNAQDDVESEERVIPIRDAHQDN